MSTQSEQKNTPNVNGAENKVKRTQISEIGKMGLLGRLFSATEYKNSICETYTSRVFGKGGRTSGVKNFSVTQKTMLEGVDFDLTYTPLKHLGYKSALCALGDIYAKCYNPVSMKFSSIILNPTSLHTISRQSSNGGMTV